VTRALDKRLPKIETQRLAALLLIDGLDQVGRKQAAKLLGVEISAEDDNYHAAEKAMAGWLDEHPDPTPLLAALAIGHLETRGTKLSPLSDYGDAGLLPGGPPVVASRHTNSTDPDRPSRTISGRRCCVIRRRTSRSAYLIAHGSAAAWSSARYPDAVVSRAVWRCSLTVQRSPLVPVARSAADACSAVSSFALGRLSVRWSSTQSPVT
jgi:hypothetical protein